MDGGSTPPISTKIFMKRIFFVFLLSVFFTGCVSQTASFVESEKKNVEGNVVKSEVAAVVVQNPVVYQKQVVAATKVPILMYHYIGDVPKNDPNILLRRDLTVSVQNFEEQMKWLQDHGYHVVSFEEAANGLLRSGFVVPEKSVVVTLDDGYEDAYTNAFPILKKYGMPGSFAIVTGFVGRPGYVTKQNVLDMDAGGMEIVSHTVTHVDLTKVSADQLERELKESKVTLEKWLGKDVYAFVYPSGRFNRRVEDAVKKAGYLFARTTQAGDMTRDSDPFVIPTIRIHGATTMAQFQKIFPSRPVRPL